MTRKNKLSASMSTDAFDRAYWYSTELARFATALGIPTATRLRKNELEQAIRACLATGRVTRLAGRPPLTGRRDVTQGLTRRLRVAVYSNDRETKAFLEREARAFDPRFVPRSGARYRLNRWREAQMARGRPITYGDLVHEYVRLCRPTTPFLRIPHGRYIGFVSDFRAANPGARFDDAVRAWRELKTLPIEKTYAAWVRRTRRI